MINVKKITKAAAFILALSLLSACSNQRLTPATPDEPASTETSVSEETENEVHDEAEATTLHQLAGTEASETSNND